MEILISDRGLTEITDDAIVLPVFEGETPRTGTIAAVDHLTGGALAHMFERREVEGKVHQWGMLERFGTSQSRLLVYGGGRVDGTSPVHLQRLAAGAVRVLAPRGFTSVAFILRREIDPIVAARAFVEGAIMGAFESDIYKTAERARSRIDRLTLVCDSPIDRSVEQAVRIARVMAEAANFARELGNEPGNVMTPSELARRASAMAEENGLATAILDEDRLKEMGCGALLAVSRGSEEPPRMITIRYEPTDAPAGDLIALVGKGITFDSGGISIKPARDMDEMKFDMGGGAAVIAAMRALATLKPPVRVMGVVPAAENLPSGRALKPGDVIRSLSGKTVEVLNTDAEGRLILADGIAYAVNEGATRVVDIATLTGACEITLGAVRSGVLGTDDDLVGKLIGAGETSGERLWRLPSDKEYAELVRSDIADLKNVGNKTAGAITAGMFLSYFAGSVPWAHLDIANTAWLVESKPYLAKGATGFGARLLAEFVLNQAKQHRNG